MDDDIFDMNPFEGSPDYGIKVKLSAADQNLLREVVREERKIKRDQKLKEKKQRKEELRKLYREGKVNLPKIETPAFIYGRLYDDKK